VHVLLEQEKTAKVADPVAGNLLKQSEGSNGPLASTTVHHQKKGYLPPAT